MRQSRRLPDRADVVVIGAGAAGVFALRELVRSGLTAVGLEARNRIGGRIFTRRTLARYPIELGAEFVHGTENIVHKLVAEYGLTMVPHVGTAYSWWDGKLGPDAELPRPPLDVLHMFGNERIRDLFVRAEWRVWHTDPYCRSGYSAFAADRGEETRQMLGLPVADTLFFAGEAVGVRGQPGKVASVHGAIESGIHCARDVIASLRT
ncbi:MAG: FAD-dependent oxidoreductase [Planctomycetia bacterium]|nr:FAD-dependent oxidoreductase [Planctomycetia bacterium]